MTCIKYDKCISGGKDKHTCSLVSALTKHPMCFKPAELTNKPTNEVSNGCNNSKLKSSYLTSQTTEQLQNKSIELKNQVITRQKLAITLLKQINNRYREISEMQNLNIKINNILINRMGGD